MKNDVKSRLLFAALLMLIFNEAFSMFVLDKDCPQITCPDEATLTDDCRKTGIFATPDGKLCPGCDVCVSPDSIQGSCPVLSCPPLAVYSVRCTVQQYFIDGWSICPACLTNICSVEL